LAALFAFYVAGCTYHYTSQEAAYWAGKAGATSSHQIHRQQQWVITPDSPIYLASTRIIGLDRSISSEALNHINNEVYRGLSQNFPRLAQSQRPKPLVDTLVLAQGQGCAYLVVPKLVYSGSPVESSVYTVNALHTNASAAETIAAGHDIKEAPVGTQLYIYAVPTGEFLDAITVTSRDGWLPTALVPGGLIGEGVRLAGQQLASQQPQRPE